MTSPRMHRRAMLAGMASGVLAASLGTARAAQTPPAPVDAIDAGTAVEITVTEGMFAMPARIPAGLVTMTLVNAGRTEHAAQILRHNDGVLLPDIMSALQHGGVGALAPLVSMAGGPGHVAPGAEQTVIQELTQGQYTVICPALGNEGVPHALTSLPHRLEVTGDGAAGEAPAATGEVRMVDFAFEGLPAEVPTGRQVWRVTSDGSEAHELGIRRLDDGVTAEMVIDVMLGGGKGYSDAQSATAGGLRLIAGLPMSPAGGIQAMAPGLAGWVEVDLEPGDYVAVSLMPSVANGGVLQTQLGMIQGFSVWS